MILIDGEMCFLFLGLIARVSAPSEVGLDFCRVPVPASPPPLRVVPLSKLVSESAGIGSLHGRPFYAYLT